MLDLAKYTSPGSKVISGRDKGIELRQKLDLDKIDSDPKIKVIVSVPETVLSLNRSFFSGLFAQSVRTFGRSGFLQKYEFKAQPRVLEDVERGIRGALKSENPLDDH